MHDILIQQMRDEVTRIGAKELRSAAEVEEVIPNARGTMLVVVNSTCGCAAGSARPGLTMAMQQPIIPDNVVTVFAGIDKEATEKARSYFNDEPPSSPSFALMRDGKLVKMIHRYNIQGHSPDQIAAQLISAFQEHCTPATQQTA